MNLKIDLPNEKATKSLGLKIAQSLPSVISDMTVVLKGEMGAGKSTVVRSVLRGMGYRNIVPSPTYTLVEPYEVHSGKIYHIDLYRINDFNDLDEINLFEINDKILISFEYFLIPVFSYLIFAVIFKFYSFSFRYYNLGNDIFYVYPLIAIIIILLNK